MCSLKRTADGLNSLIALENFRLANSKTNITHEKHLTSSVLQKALSEPNALSHNSENSLTVWIERTSEKRFILLFKRKMQQIFDKKLQILTL